MTENFKKTEYIASIIDDVNIPQLRLNTVYRMGSDETPLYLVGSEVDENTCNFKIYLKYEKGSGWTDPVDTISIINAPNDEGLRRLITAIADSKVFKIADVKIEKSLLKHSHGQDTDSLVANDIGLSLNYDDEDDSKTKKSNTYISDIHKLELPEYIISQYNTLKNELVSDTTLNNDNKNKPDSSNNKIPYKPNNTNQSSASSQSPDKLEFDTSDKKTSVAIGAAVTAGLAFVGAHQFAKSEDGSTSKSWVSKVLPTALTLTGIAAVVYAAINMWGGKGLQLKR